MNKDIIPTQAGKSDFAHKFKADGLYKLEIEVKNTKKWLLLQKNKDLEWFKYA